MIRKRIRLAQNFFRDPRLVVSIVADSSIGKDDVVYEIGPGDGIITKELAARAGTVIAIEKDSALAAELQRKFHGTKNAHIYAGDFLKYPIKEKAYKIFSNIPFNITADVVKRILFENNPPQEAYLIVQKEAAEKFSGLPNETETSVLAKPWFSIETIREFRRTDFEPVPSVDVVLLRITKRKEPLVAPEQAEKYRRFIRFGFEMWKKDLKTVYKRVFTYEQWKRLSKDLSFPLKATPTELIFEQWLGLFRYFLTGVADSKKAVVFSRRL
jgi:16S rRNA A1518/A1519 N6-dimethyltransferase RsmA/KsgA/DIM1 with predicted DNA glycosylase/AP lyase activity